LNLNVKFSGMLNTSSRVRYNAWDLLADVGGFSDGLTILGLLLTTLFA